MRILFLLLAVFFHVGLRLASSLNQDGVHLFNAKLGLADPNDRLSTWNRRDANPCAWAGVSCSADNPPSITALNLSGFDLEGPFPISICRLPNLATVDLSSNNLNSSLADVRLAGGCAALSHLDLSVNYLVGPLPDDLAALPNLTFLDLSMNNFSGAIPPSFGRFPRIETLRLVYNFLDSTIPSFLGNLSALRDLSLGYNPFDASPVPDWLGNLSRLENLYLANCNLHGEIPPVLGKLERLTNLDLSTNHLSGSIPQAIFGLSSIVQIELYLNNLTGRIPVGLAKVATLRRFDASANQLEGPLPDDIFDAPLLDNLHIYSNRLGGRIPAGIARSKNLVDIRLYDNQLEGDLPANFGKNSPLETLDLSTNSLSGQIPASICDRGALKQLLLIENSFSGKLPDGLGRCRTLNRVRLQSNRLSGAVPTGLWGLPHVSLLDLRNNTFSGSISPAISGAANLSVLLIDDNQFSGRIPSEMGAVSKLYEFSAANNLLTGPLPASLGNLAELGRLNLHNNSLSGELLRGIQSWNKLVELDLSHNIFTGGIPSELGDLPVLNYLDLSSNDLSGAIPIQLQNLNLNRFNFSDNELSGPVPPLFANEIYISSFWGNPALCGDIPGLCPVSGAVAGDRRGFTWLLRSIFMLAGLVFVAGMSWFVWRYRDYKKATDKSKWTLKSFHKLGFSEYEIMDSLDEDNVIGSGSSGKVYKVVLSNGEAVAVKKLRAPPQADVENLEQLVDDTFEAEVAMLGNIRHKNIVKLWCCCTHKDLKLLVYEYMPNGSLGDLLHSSKGRILDWPMRYKIALDAAEGLSYLHHDCVPPIVHRDVKSNNILLDVELGAKVADFGVAKAVDVIGKGLKSMSVIAGSCGYIAPEYAYTLRVNEKSDIYSFGVVILELVTGKPPVDPEYGEKDLVKWACGVIEQKGVEHVIDPKLDMCYKGEISRVLDIGLLCASSLPINRPAMRRVVKMLQEVRWQNKTRGDERKDGKLSPYH